MRENRDAAVAMMAARIADMRKRGHSARASEMAEHLFAIRRMAMANGFGPVLPVVQALDHILSKQTHHAPIEGWLDLLDEAVGYGQQDPRAESAFAAYCSSRLGC